MRNGDEVAGIDRLLSELRPDIELVRHYGEDHAEVFVDVKVDRLSASIVVLLWGDEDGTYEAARRATVLYPDRCGPKPCRGRRLICSRGKSRSTKQTVRTAAGGLRPLTRFLREGSGGRPPHMAALAASSASVTGMPPSISPQ
jgi:hypothetical protein